MERNTEMLEKQKADLRKEIRGQLRLLPEEEKEILIPAIRQCILEVDVEEGRMKVHLLEGLV